jgi:hypothetical protein
MSSRALALQNMCTFLELFWYWTYVELYCVVLCLVVTGACKLALHFKLTVLAEHIQAFINQRIEWEEEQAAAAAAAAQQVRLCQGVSVRLIGVEVDRVCLGVWAAGWGWLDWFSRRLQQAHIQAFINQRIEWEEEQAAAAQQVGLCQWLWCTTHWGRDELRYAQQCGPPRQAGGCCVGLGAAACLLACYVGAPVLATAVAVQLLPEHA